MNRTMYVCGKVFMNNEIFLVVVLDVWVLNKQSD